MPSIQIRECPEPIYLKLCQLAEQDHRSLAQEATYMLAKGLGIELSQMSRRKALLNAWEASGVLLPQEQTYSDPLQYLKEDRQR